MMSDQASKPIRVVHLLHTVAHGGIETILVNWLRLLNPAEIEAHMVVFANPGATEKPFIEAAERAGLKVRTIPWSRRKPIFTAASKLKAILREVQADVVHTHNVYAELVGYLAARAVGAKVLTTQYVWADFGWKRNIQQWVSARLIRRFDLVTSQCLQTMRETTRRGIPVEKQKVLISGILPNATRLSAAERDAKRSQHGISPQDVVFVNIARLFPEKAQDHLLRSFAKIVESRPHARLWILGVGPLEAQLKQLCSELGLDDSVRFVGFLPEMREVLPIFDIQIHPSDAEGVPLAVCEGMAAALAIVATSVGGITEMIEHEKSGLLVNARDESSLVRESIRLIDDAALRKRLGNAARHFIDEEYSLTKAVRDLTQTYRELVGSEAARSHS